jgi:hypothetical protein
MNTTPDTPDDDEPRLFPPWRQTLKQLEAMNVQPGQTITKEWLEASFGMRPARTIAEHERNHHLFRKLFWMLRTELLETHQLMLRAVAGVGYEVVEPQRQTQVALRDRGLDVARALQKLNSELTHIRHDLLTEEQRKENADALAKVGVLTSMATKQLTNTTFDHGGARPGED